MSLEAVQAWWETPEKLYCYWPPYTRSNSCQSVVTDDVSQSAASSSSSALVWCSSASPAGCGRFVASRCRRPSLRSLAVRSHSLMTSSTSALLADFVRRLSRTASAQQHKYLLPITSNHLFTMSCPLSNYLYGYCGTLGAKDLVSPTPTLEVSFPILFRASEVNTGLYTNDLTWYQCSWVASGFAFIFCSVLHQP